MSTMKLPIDQIYVFPDIEFRVKVYTRERLEAALQSLFDKFNNDGLSIITFLEDVLNPKVEVVEEKPKALKDLIAEALDETAKSLHESDIWNPGATTGAHEIVKPKKIIIPSSFSSSSLDDEEDIDDLIKDLDKLSK